MLGCLHVHVQHSKMHSAAERVELYIIQLFRVEMCDRKQGLRCLSCTTPLFKIFKQIKFSLNTVLSHNSLHVSLQHEKHF